MEALYLLDRLDACLAAVEESGAAGGCPYCTWNAADGPQHPTACRIGEMRAALDRLDESGCAPDALPVGAAAEGVLASVG